VVTEWNQVKPILRLLLVEDSEMDAALAVRMLQQAGYEVRPLRVDDLEVLRKALSCQPWDVIVCDYSLPGLQAPEVLTIVKQTGLDIPFIVVSGSIGEEPAVAMMRSGAHDYLMKGNLARLAPAVARELADAANRRRGREAVAAKEESDRRVREFAQTQAAILNALTANIALVSQGGVILAINESWRQFPAANLLLNSEHTVGTNYLEACDRIQGEHSDEVRAAVTGIRRVLAGETREFSMEYRSHSPEETRWFRMIVTPLHADRNAGAVVKHLDITENIDAENGRRHREKLEQSLALAMNVQRSLLPENDPQIPGLDVAGRSQYCDATGGDYYDFIDVSSMNQSGLFVAVGDVSGHGIAAALVMASARAVVHAHINLVGDLPALMTTVNTVLARNTRHGRFMTMMLAAIDPRAGTLRWSSAGHDAPFVYHPDTQEFEDLNQSDLVLGIDPTAEYGEYSYAGLRVGDLVFIGTDGIWEMRGPDGRQFGKERLRRFISENHHESAMDIADALEIHLAQFLQGGPAQDDVTYVVIKMGETQGVQKPESGRQFRGDNAPAGLSTATRSLSACL
jgi:serine phosphatase RsbU (regulator of sigma subunit)/CheY-like chemotaxis protein